MSSPIGLVIIVFGISVYVFMGARYMHAISEASKRAREKVATNEIDRWFEAKSLFEALTDSRFTLQIITGKYRSAGYSDDVVKLLERARRYVFIGHVTLACAVIAFTSFLKTYSP